MERIDICSDISRRRQTMKENILGLSLLWSRCGGCGVRAPRAGGEHVPDNYTTRDDPATLATVRPRGREEGVKIRRSRRSSNPFLPTRSRRPGKASAASGPCSYFRISSLNITVMVLSRRQFYLSESRGRRETAKM